MNVTLNPEMSSSLSQQLLICLIETASRFNDLNDSKVNYLFLYLNYILLSLLFDFDCSRIVYKLFQVAAIREKNRSCTSVS